MRMITDTFGVVDMSNGSTVFNVRIDNDIDAFALPIPSCSKFNVTGLLGQFDNATPFTEGYQLLPRYITDFVSVSSSYDTELDPAAEVYPNPVNNIVTVKTNSNPDYISIYDTKGSVLNTVKNTLQLDFTSFSSGVYMVRLVKGQKASTIRVVKI